MTERRATQMLACLLCAKRKVRCDRTEPCSQCNRRGTSCEYPQLVRGRRQQIPDPSTRGVPSVQSNQSSSPGKGTKRSIDGTPVLSETTNDSKPGLVELNTQSTYIEAPVWYSLPEARKPANELQNSQHNDKLTHDSFNPDTGYHRSILDRRMSDNSDVQHEHPSSEGIRTLWQVFLANVHPVVKLFFDWDKQPIIQQATVEPAKLSRSQQALCFAIYFVAVLSLSDDECIAKLDGSSRTPLLKDWQSATENALLAADYTSTSDISTLQALVLYMLAMRNRAKPATSFSLLGVAVRIAQRMGLHRDGKVLGLPPAQAEERRRVWWQLQYVEIAVSQLVGTLSMTLYAGWDTQMPANIEDEDLTPDMAYLPVERPGLTSMSHCLWRYDALAMNGKQGKLDVGTPGKSSLDYLRVITSSQEKTGIMVLIRKFFTEKYLQYCEPIVPLQVSIQIGLQNFLLAMERGFLQPNTSTRISEMSMSNRDELLQVCIKSMDYFILGQTTPAISQWRWHYENYFQWTALVYIVLEAHHRANTPEVSKLWSLINRVCEVFPKLTIAVDCTEVSAVANLIVLAWQERREHLSAQQVEEEKPWCVDQLEKALGISASAAERDDENLQIVRDGWDDFDFDLIDWSAWDNGLFSREDQ